jgi:hypothetical protein
MLANAQGVAIIPSVIKGGFIIGARHGRGVLVVRDENGAWHLPVFITLTGGNIGLQAGLQSTDVVLVFKTRQSIQGILSNRLTLGADAAVAAGPVGRQAAAATDASLKAEIYSYSRSRGLFAGVAIDGSVLQVDRFADAAYYQTPDPSHPAIVPESANKLMEQIIQYCAATPTPPGVAAHQQPVLAQAHATTEADALRGQLAQVARQLSTLLDPQWRTYLGLPSEVFTGNSHPSVEALRRSLSHFDTVGKDPQYRALAARPEFQSTYGLLQHYVGVLAQDKPALNLPPPPGWSRVNGAQVNEGQK